LLHGLLVGVCGAFITGDVFNLYVWFEVLLVGSFALLVLGGGKRRLAGTVVYVVLNLVATMMFLLAAGLLYGASGSLNMALNWRNASPPAKCLRTRKRRGGA
jgi:multicomponent Na+:H+ antiporter subunit D